jgi:dTDP-4-amino-4,6-dideoxygalactose transaminase
LDQIAAFGLPIVEDAAQSHGSSWQGKPTGYWCHASATSFYPTKNLGAFGEAGAVTTNDPALAARIRSLRNYGAATRYVSEDLGINSRLDELQAAMLAAQLPYLTTWNAERKGLADMYRRRLEGVGDIRFQECPQEAESVNHLMVVRTRSRDELQRWLTSKGIGTQVHYPVPMHLLPCYAELGGRPGDFPVAEAWAAEVLSLPQYVGMGDEAVVEVVDAVRAFFR